MTDHTTSGTAATKGEYVVARIAKNNPDINGRKLYLTHIGLWTTQVEHARCFLSRSEARKSAGADCVVERAALSKANGEQA